MAKNVSLTFIQVDDSVTVTVNGKQVFTHNLLRYNQPHVIDDLSKMMISGTNTVSLTATNILGSGTLEANLTADGKVLKTWKVVGDSRYHHAPFTSGTFTFDYAGAVSVPTAQATPTSATTAPGPACDTGWTYCTTLADPKINIQATAKVSQSAIDNVKNIYSTITANLSSAYPKSKFDGYKIYITNGEPWTQLSSLAPIATLWPGVTPFGIANGDEIRGGTTDHWLWIDEEMMCKTGVATRNEQFKNKTRAEADDIVRTYDQAIHEFSHAIGAVEGLYPEITALWSQVGGWDKPNHVEEFPYAVQYMYGAPVDSQAAGTESFLKKVFTNITPTALSCSTYVPVARG